MHWWQASTGWLHVVRRVSICQWTLGWEGWNFLSPSRENTDVACGWFEKPGSLRIYSRSLTGQLSRWGEKGSYQCGEKKNGTVHTNATIINTAETTDNKQRICSTKCQQRMPCPADCLASLSGLPGLPGLPSNWHQMLRLRGGFSLRGSLQAIFAWHLGLETSSSVWLAERCSLRTACRGTAAAPVQGVLCRLGWPKPDLWLLLFDDCIVFAHCRNFRKDKKLLRKIKVYKIKTVLGSLWEKKGETF